MNETAAQAKRDQKWIRLAARIWSAPIILFVLYFALGSIWSWITNGAADPHAVQEITWLESLTLIFFGLSGLGLALAWRWEKSGGLVSLFCTAGVYLTLLVQGLTTGDFSRFMIPALMAILILIPGILFLIVATRGSQDQTA